MHRAGWMGVDHEDVGTGLGLLEPQVGSSTLGSPFWSLAWLSLAILPTGLWPPSVPSLVL